MIMNKFILCENSSTGYVLVNLNKVKKVVNVGNKPFLICDDDSSYFLADKNIEFIHFVANFSIDLATGK